MTYTETDLVAAIERLAGVDIGALTHAQRDGIDQFHSGGAQAVDRLLSGLDLTAGMTVLDVGSGLGGPARQIARTTGCRVVGVDITPSYVSAAQALSAAAGLAEQAQFLCTDIANLDRADFDAAYTMHVQMNVADKSTFFTDIAQRLRPRAPLATFEVCRAGPAEPDLPLPWSLDGTDSHLASPAELLDTIQGSGFNPADWVDDTAWVAAWFQELGTRLAAAATQATLPALLTDGPTRMMNLATALSTGALTIHRGAFTLAA
jgi:sarcosine/dimethylglycine N-methyltransferase